MKSILLLAALSERTDLRIWSPLAPSDGKLILRGQARISCVRMAGKK